MYVSSFAISGLVCQNNFDRKICTLASRYMDPGMLLQSVFCLLVWRNNRVGRREQSSGSPSDKRRCFSGIVKQNYNCLLFQFVGLTQVLGCNGIFHSSKWIKNTGHSIAEDKAWSNCTVPVV